MGLSKDPDHLLVFSSLQSLRFKHFPSIQDHNLLPRPLFWVCGILSPSFFAAPGIARSRVSESQLSVCQRMRYRQALQHCLYLMTPCSQEFRICYFGLVQVMVKHTTSPHASCSSHAAASSLEAESCVLDIHVLHTQLPTVCLHSRYVFTPMTPPKSNAFLGGLIKLTHLLVFSFHSLYIHSLIKLWERFASLPLPIAPETHSFKSYL